MNPHGSRGRFPSRGTGSSCASGRSETKGSDLRVLGAILAGGKAQRFGSDKAHALWRGERLIDRFAAALGPQCEDLVVCGREEPGFTSLPDRPEAGLGPLGGLNAALHHARDNGFDAVLADRKSTRLNSSHSQNSYF